MANLIISLVITAIGGCVLWAGIRSAAWLSRHLDSVMDAAVISGDMDAICNAQIEREEPTGGGLILFMLVAGLTLVIFGLGGVFHCWDVWQFVVTSLNDPYY